MLPFICQNFMHMSLCVSILHLTKIHLDLIGIELIIRWWAKSGRRDHQKLAYLIWCISCKESGLKSPVTNTTNVELCGKIFTHSLHPKFPPVQNKSLSWIPRHIVFFTITDTSVSTIRPKVRHYKSEMLRELLDIWPPTRCSSAHIVTAQYQSFQFRFSLCFHI